MAEQPSGTSRLLIIHFENTVQRLKHFPGGTRADLLSGIREALGLPADSPLRFLDEEGDVVVISPSMPSGTILHASVAIGLHVSQLPSNSSALPNVSQLVSSSQTLQPKDKPFDFSLPPGFSLDFPPTGLASSKAPTNPANTPTPPASGSTGFNFEPPVAFSSASAPSTPVAFMFTPSSTPASAAPTPFVFGAAEKKPTPAPAKPSEPIKWAYTQGGELTSPTKFQLTPRDGSESWAAYSTPFSKTTPTYFVLKCAFRFCCTAVGVIPVVVASLPKGQHLTGKDLSNRAPNCPKLLSLKGLLSGPSKAFDSSTGDKKEPVSIGVFVDPENNMVLYLDDEDPKASAKWVVTPVPAAAFPVKLIVASPKHGTKLALEDKPIPEFLTSSQRLTIKNEGKYRAKKTF
jgi:hypothetical protein